MSVRNIAAVSLTTLVAACATVQAPAPTVRVPDSLQPGANQALSLVVPARGYQVYECRANPDRAGALEWAFVAPDADLYDTAGRKIGTHYAGPHWEAADGSKVVGKVTRRADAPETGAIPWLLLEAKSVGHAGAFSRVTSIQRVATVGGVAPAGGCTQVGATSRVPYTADYYFFVAQ